MEAMEKKNVELNVEGMTCSNCAMGIENYLKKKGFEDVHVDFSNAEVVFTSTEAKELDEVINGIEDLGYKVVSKNEETDGAGKRLSPIAKKFIFCAIFTVPLLLHMVVSHDHLLNNPWLQLALCLPVYVVGMFHFGKSAWNSLKTGIPNMDVLITLGTSAAFFYSLTGAILQLGHNYLFYETAATIITLVLLGNLLEHRSVKKTTSAIRELSQLQPEKAKVIIDEEKSIIKESDVKEIKKGQLLLVNTGDKVPVDGTVDWGEGTIDESAITGESVPVEKQKGDEVIGSTLLKSGSLKIRAVAIGKDTVMAKIIDMVKKAQSEPPEIQRLADKISGIFVPVVLGIAVLTFLLSFLLFGITAKSAMLNAVAVLVISCPCAMGLATPTAVMVGIGKAARNGILIKGGQTLQTFAKIKHVVFDKTGTLTTGQFKIKKLTTYDEEKETVKQILFSLEQHSSHPIARSVMRELEGTSPIGLLNIHEEKGMGVSGKDKEGNKYEAGSYVIAKELTDDDGHDIYLVKNKKLMAALDIEDELKPDAKETIDYFKKNGVRTVLLSGDIERKCKEVADHLGIDEYYAEKKPDEKLQILEEYVQKQPTAMVGDGINDAPALTKATIGISISNATQAAIQSADVILLKDKFSYLARASRISKQTLITIKQNLFWAFFYNVLAIPVAAVGLLSPMIAAFSMAFSDVIVIGNSLRLRSKK